MGTPLAGAGAEGMLRLFWEGRKKQESGTNFC